MIKPLSHYEIRFLMSQERLYQYTGKAFSQTGKGFSATSADED